MNKETLKPNCTTVSTTTIHKGVQTITKELELWINEEYTVDSTNPLQRHTPKTDTLIIMFKSKELDSDGERKYVTLNKTTDDTSTDYFTSDDHYCDSHSITNLRCAPEKEYITLDPIHVKNKVLERLLNE